jgi:hypothetical protein
MFPCYPLLPSKSKLALPYNPLKLDVLGRMFWDIQEEEQDVDRGQAQAVEQAQAQNSL